MESTSLQPVRHTVSPFDGIRQFNGDQEYWSARDLQQLLEYTKWEHFEEVIENATKWGDYEDRES